MNYILVKDRIKKRSIGNVLFYSIDNSTAQQIRNYFDKSETNEGKIDFFYEQRHAAVNYLIGADGWMAINFVSLGNQ